MIFFGTCGRGLEKFAQDELDDIDIICSTKVIAEGKLLFCISSPYIQEDNRKYGNPDSILEMCSHHKCVRNYPVENSLHQQIYTLDNIDILKPLFNLKLLEKVHLLLYCNNVGDSNRNNTMEELFNINYKNIMEFISQARKLNGSIATPWRGCSNATTCYASLTRHQEKTSIKRKRRKMDQDDDDSMVHVINSPTLKEQECVNLPNDTSYIQPPEEDFSEMNTFLVSCRIRGVWRKIWKPFHLSKSISKTILKSNETWSNVLQKANLNLYINLNDDWVIAGVSLTDKPLSLRSYIPHITLRSTICSLMIRLAGISEGHRLLDPMAGVGTILVEAAATIRNLLIIANDINPQQLSAAQCNIRHVNNVDIIMSDARALPLRTNCVDAVVCDFPFGKKHSITLHEDLMQSVFKECSRVLKNEGRMVFLVSAKQQLFVKDLVSGLSTVQLLRVDPVSLGLTRAFLITCEAKKPESIV